MRNSIKFLKLSLCSFLAFIFLFGFTVKKVEATCDATPGATVITSSCSFPKLNTGIDNGPLEVRSGVLTIDGNQIIAFGSLNLTGGSLAISSGAKLLPGMYIWMIDADADGYPATTTEYVQRTAPVNGRRKYLMTSSDILDCSDSAYSANNYCCTQAWYRDVDGDGFGDPAAQTTQACTPVPAGYVANNTDCNDANAAVNRTISPARYLDADGDTFGTGALTSCAPTTGNYTATNATDCNDANAAVNRTISPAKYLDADGDTYGTGALTSCAPTAGNYTSAVGTDCNDANASVFRAVNGYLDADGDGYGAGALATCVGAAGSYVATNTDCGPSNASAKPGSATCLASTFTNASGVASYDWNCSASGGAGTRCGTLMWTSAQYLGIGYRWDCSAGTCHAWAARGYFSTLSPTRKAAACGAAGFTSGPTGPASCITCSCCTSACQRSGRNCTSSGQEGPMPGGAQTCN